MQSVNKLIFGRNMDFRPPLEDMYYIDTLQEVLKRPENTYARVLVKRLENAKIKNIGERGSLELFGALAIFLTQIPEKQVDNIDFERHRRL